jgi:hypothetical protein
MYIPVRNARAFATAARFIVTNGSMLSPTAQHSSVMLCASAHSWLWLRKFSGHRHSMLRSFIFCWKLLIISSAQQATAQSRRMEHHLGVVKLWARASDHCEAQTICASHLQELHACYCCDETDLKEWEVACYRVATSLYAGRDLQMQTGHRQRNYAISRPLQSSACTC